ncbi:hypothetical protein [Paenibacillus ferrarius]|uniref:hypothetical protein n=1 Tax=Paenibacillus ferrarius TaxID=1469647 RepID=UPI003D2692FE
MAKAKAERTENQVYSSRVARSEFDRNWTTTITSSGYVVYTAQATPSRVTVLLTNGASKLLTFRRGGKVLVGSGGVSHYSKPHTAKDL